MTDRELLESAARAAGVKGGFVERCPEDGAPTYSCGIGSADQITPLWNALTNDGDALRLAVDLGLRIEQFPGVVDGFCEVQNLDVKYRAEQRYVLDPYAATRRAIVRAAAAIGEQRKGDEP